MYTDDAMQYPTIPWRLMAGMRDKLIHDDSGADLKHFVQIVLSDLPIIKAAIAQVLSDLSSQP